MIVLMKIFLFFLSYPLIIVLEIIISIIIPRGVYFVVIKYVKVQDKTFVTDCIKLNLKGDEVKNYFYKFRNIKNSN